MAQEALVNRDSSWVVPASALENIAAEVGMVAAIAMTQLVAAVAATAMAAIAAVALLAAVAAVVAAVAKMMAFDHNHARDCPYAERWCYSRHSAFQKGVAASYYS
jgi:hypothetical protein